MLTANGATLLDVVLLEAVNGATEGVVLELLVIDVD